MEHKKGARCMVRGNHKREDKDCQDGEEKLTEEKLLRRIVVDPKTMLGKPVIRGTRLTVEMIVEKIAYGATIEDLKSEYPFLKEEDVRAALLYAARRLAHEEVFAA
jgi:uncharacterized protein (DUF433 family)